MKRRDLMLSSGTLLLVGMGATIVERRHMGTSDDHADAQGRLRAALATSTLLKAGAHTND